MKTQRQAIERASDRSNEADSEDGFLWIVHVTRPSAGPLRRYLRFRFTVAEQGAATHPAELTPPDPGMFDDPPHRIPPVPGPPLRRWLERELREPGVLAASGTHSGPEGVAVDKGNQDFCFHTRLTSPSGDWVLSGVADGVSASPWSDRGARHAAAAFQAASAACIRENLLPLQDDGRAFGERFAQTFVEGYRARVQEDEALLLRRRVPDPTWNPQLFLRRFVDTGITDSWFQTTLLAVALGETGGFALLLGDGFGRVDRIGSSGSIESSRLHVGQEHHPFAWRGLQPGDVIHALVQLRPRGAAQMRVLLATDGVSGCPEPSLRSAFSAAGELQNGQESALDIGWLDGEEPIRQFLSHLAGLPLRETNLDNMSVAVTTRQFRKAGAS